MTSFRTIGLLVLASTMALTACSTTDPKDDQYIVADLASRDEVVCKRRRPSGSHIPKLICRSRGQMEEDQQTAMRAVGPLRNMGGTEMQAQRPR